MSKNVQKCPTARVAVLPLSNRGSTRLGSTLLAHYQKSRICTSHVERQNLTTRMQIRRFTCLTNGFSKKWENHWAALCLCFAYYNFCRFIRPCVSRPRWKRALRIASGSWRICWRRHRWCTGVTMGRGKFRETPMRLPLVENGWPRFKLVRKAASLECTMSQSVLVIRPPIEDEMPLTLNKDDKQWISDKIHSGLDSIKSTVDTAIAEAIAKVKPRRLATVATVTIAIGVVAIFLTLLGFVLTEHHAATHRLEEDAVFRTHTNDRLDVIEGLLRDLRVSQSPGPVLKELGNLSQPAFAKSLPTLQKITTQPVAAVAPSPDTLREVAVKLHQTDSATPDYWGTTLQFIRWASAAMSPNTPGPNAPRIELHNSTIQGNAMALNERVIVLDGTTLSGVVIERSRIIFSGAQSTLRNVAFIDCVFEFPVTNEPPAPLKQFSEQLLAAGMERAVINIG